MNVFSRYFLNALRINTFYFRGDIVLVEFGSKDNTRYHFICNNDFNQTTLGIFVKSRIEDTNIIIPFTITQNAHNNPPQFNPLFAHVKFCCRIRISPLPNNYIKSRPYILNLFQNLLSTSWSPVYTAHLTGTVGTEIFSKSENKPRPVLLLQTNTINNENYYICLPLRGKSNNSASTFSIEKNNVVPNLKKNSWVRLDQITSLHKDRIKERVGYLDKKLAAKIKKKFCKLFLYAEEKKEILTKIGE